jgi:phospholipase/carboxylesterase
VLLAHGTADEVVPYASLDHAAKGLRAAGIEVETLSCPDVGHGIDQSGLMRGAEFLHKVLTV